MKSEKSETLYELAEEELNRAHDELETRINERTAGLVEANEALQTEITERKRVEQALLESEQRYRSLFENMLDGFAYCKMLFDDYGHPVDFVYLKVNSAFGRLTGLENVVGKKITEIIPGIKELYPELFEIYGQVALTGKPEKFEIEFKPVEAWLSISVYSTKREYFVAVFENITERKQAEEALRQSEERHRLLAETMLQGVVHQDADGKIISMNPAAEWILGKSPEEFLGGTSVSVEHNTVREDGSPFPGLEHPSMVALRTGQKIKDVVMGVYNPREQGYRWINISAVPLFRQREDRPHQVYTVFEDITERKLAEEALYKARDELETRIQERTAELEEANVKLKAEIEERERSEKALQSSETMYRRLAESIGEVFYALDKDLKYTYWNNASEKLTGISAEDAIGKSLFELFPELKGSRTEKLYREVLKTQRPKRFVNKYRVNGKNLIFEINAYYSKFGISIIAKDITERKHAEEQIREQATLLDNAQEAIGVRSLEHSLIYWNKGAERLYGWTAEEAVGKNPVEFLFKDKEEPPQLIEAKRIVLEKGGWIGELRQVTKDGRDVIVESHWTLIRDSEGKPKSILVVNTDITEKKKFESQLLRAQRMEGIGTLAGGIAHDLNNVLTPVMLSLQMLEEKFTDEQSQKLLTILERNLQRGSNLIKQVMSFARGIEGERKPLQAAHVISEIEKVARETFNKNIEIRIDISRDLFTISGDATQLYQVIMNMCVNARDAMPDGGVLEISAKNFLVDENYVRMNTEAKVGPYIIISVSDTGIGIPPKIMDRIFEPFFTTKEPGKGTGLGLSTSLGIVKSHGGFINVNSEVGEGTIFKTYLPAFKTEVQGAQMQQPELLTGQGEMILVAEDEGSIREITCSTLETYGYEVIAAEDGAQAVAEYAQNTDKVKVILMDMMMPVMDGQASIRAVRKINPYVKIIGVSGLVEKDKIKNIANHTNAFLPKPYTAEVLLKTVHEVLTAE